MTAAPSPEKVTPIIGQPFNPYRGVCGFYPPNAVRRQRGIGDGQKFLYECLVRYAGKNGQCYPSILTLADDLGSLDLLSSATLQAWKSPVLSVINSAMEGGRTPTFFCGTQYLKVH